MKRIGFHDRGGETDEIMNILDTEPSLITFVYGPINSGKTTMISHLIKELPEEYAPFYVNLRGRFITDYEDFLNGLFEIDEDERADNGTEYAKSILKDLGAVGGIPIPIDLFEQIFKNKDKSKDIFKYMEQFFVGISKKRTPVLIIDELQVVGDLKVDDLLIYKLFNFFIRLTKELHICHVFVVSSDSPFIEHVCSEAMLQGRSRHLLVDDFNEGATMDFLDRYNFSDKEKTVVWEYCGGKPVYLVELINQKLGDGAVKEKCEDIFKVRVSQLRDLLDLLGYVTPQVLLEGTEYQVEREKVVEILKDFVDQDVVSFEGYRPEKHFMVKKNILFLDPKEGTVRPQSRLDLLAVREVMKDV